MGLAFAEMTTVPLAWPQLRLHDLCTGHKENSCFLEVPMLFFRGELIQPILQKALQSKYKRMDIVRSISIINSIKNNLHQIGHLWEPANYPCGNIYHMQ